MYSHDLLVFLNEYSYVTPSLRVVCRSLKEYNAYRNFLELEFMKLRKREEEEMRERERKVCQSLDQCSYIHIRLYTECNGL